jgi:hypothetical protein
MKPRKVKRGNTVYEMQARRRTAKRVTMLRPQSPHFLGAASREEPLAECAKNAEKIRSKVNFHESWTTFRLFLCALSGLCERFAAWSQ